MGRSGCGRAAIRLTASVRGGYLLTGDAMEATMPRHVTVIGAGLAGSECAWQLARRGVRVTLREMKPHVRSPAHKSDGMAELVCSNSFRSDSPESAIGMLHRELRALGS